MVEATLNYLAPMEERPVYYTYPPPPGSAWRNTRGDRRVVAIGDARELAPEPSLEREGFALVRHEASRADPFDADAVRDAYYPEVERLVREATGAERVVAFDHNLRSAGTGGDGVQQPVRYVHNDYTEGSGPQRVRDLMGDEAEALLRRRFAVVNVWRPLRGPVRGAPLAFCDARSIRPSDLVPTDLLYPDRSGEVYSLTFHPDHRWFYYPEMRADEVLLLTCYDSRDGRAHFTAHSAFDDPHAPPDAPPRESIEVRTLAFF